MRASSASSQNSSEPQKTKQQKDQLIKLRVILGETGGARDSTKTRHRGLGRRDYCFSSINMIQQVNSTAQFSQLVSYIDNLVVPKLAVLGLAAFGLGLGLAAGRTFPLSTCSEGFSSPEYNCILGLQSVS